MERAGRAVMIHDCPFLFEGVRSILAGVTGMRIVGEARNATDVLVLCSESPPDIVIVDIGAGESEALRMLEQVKELCAEVHIVVLTSARAPQRMRAAITAGVQGLVSRNSGGEQLLTAMRAVLRGRCYVDPELAGVLMTTVAMIAEEELPSADAGYGLLTAREREVFGFLATGLNKKSIAYELGISHKTVETHYLHIARKLDLHDAVELIRYAVAIGVIEMEEWAAV